MRDLSSHVLKGRDTCSEWVLNLHGRWRNEKQWEKKVPCKTDHTVGWRGSLIMVGSLDTFNSLLLTLGSDWGCHLVARQPNGEQILHTSAIIGSWPKRLRVWVYTLLICLSFSGRLAVCLCLGWDFFSVSVLLFVRQLDLAAGRCGGKKVCMLLSVFLDFFVWLVGWMIFFALIYVFTYLFDFFLFFSLIWNEFFFF